MTTCEVFETRGPADEWERICNRRAVGWCYDCGIGICDQHTVPCWACHSKFCAACVTFHLEEHFRLAQSTHRHRVRKSA